MNKSFVLNLRKKISDAFASLLTRSISSRQSVASNKTKYFENGLNVFAENPFFCPTYFLGKY